MSNRSDYFDPLELIPRAFSIASVTDFTGDRSARGSDTLAKLDIMAAVAASRFSDGDVGPELMLDHALHAGGLPTQNQERVIAVIMRHVGQVIQLPIRSEKCVDAAAISAYFDLVYSVRLPRDSIASGLCVRAGTYRAHAQCADDFASHSLNRAIARFKAAIRPSC